MKTALVLSGGGSRGAYEIGVCKALEELGIKIDMVFGTSVGAITSAMVAQGDLDLAEKLWLELSTDMVFDLKEPGHSKVTTKPKFAPSFQEKITDFTDKVKEKFSEVDIAGIPAEEAAAYLREIVTKGGAANTGLMNMMKKYIDENKVRGSHIEFGLVATELPSLSELTNVASLTDWPGLTDLINPAGRPNPANNPNPADLQTTSGHYLKGHYMYLSDIPQGQLVEYIMASASCFPAVQVCEINHKKYIDGGYWDNLPIKMALDKGADEIIAVDLKAVGIVHQNHIAKARESCSSFTQIKPAMDTGNMLTFDKEHTARLIILGYLDTMRMYGKYDGKKYTFEKGAFSESEINAADKLAVKLSMNPAVVYNRSSFLDELLRIYPAD